MPKRTLTREAIGRPKRVRIIDDEKDIRSRTRLLRYKHHVLDTSSLQIRLFRLLEERICDGHLQGHLQTFDISEAPRYTALSYTWMTPRYRNVSAGRYRNQSNQLEIYLDDTPGGESHSLIIDNKRLFVNENLHDFLVTFHEITEDVHSQWLWIDQICIDQRRLAERNHQVGLMSLIYTKCDLALAWLGLDDHGLPFIDHPYFKRQWIIQELVLSKNLSFLYGSKWIKAGHMLEWGPFRPVIQYARSIDDEDSKMSLELCLSEFVNTECSEKRDYVYGFLGIVKPEQRPLVDYSKSLKEVFLDVVLLILDTTGSPSEIRVSDENMEHAAHHVDDIVEDGLHNLFRNLLLDNRSPAGSLTMEDDSFEAAWRRFRVSLIHSGVTRYANRGGKSIRKVTAVGYENDIWWHEYGGKRVCSCRISEVGVDNLSHNGSAQIVYKYKKKMYQGAPLPELDSNGKPLPLEKRELVEEDEWWTSADGKRTFHKYRFDSRRC